MALTYDWCKKVLDEQGMPGGLSHKSLQAAGFWLLRNVPGGRGERTPERKRYVKKSDGGDGRGGEGSAEHAERWQSKRLRAA